MKVAIHQPNFIPWRPFFAKMAAVDRFVILNHCQFNREHYQHRFRYRDDRWYTMSVRDVRHPELICNRVYAKPQEDWDSIKRRLPQFKTWFDQFDGCIAESLWATNYRLIVCIAAKLGIDVGKIKLDTSTAKTGTDRLVEICQLLNATTYLAGRSGADYMELEKFEAAGIKVEFQNITDTRHVFET